MTIKSVHLAPEVVDTYLIFITIYYDRPFDEVKKACTKSKLKLLNIVQQCREGRDPLRFRKDNGPLYLSGVELSVIRRWAILVQSKMPKMILRSDSELITKINNHLGFVGVKGV